jgi:putative acetyltransferase
MFPLLAPRLLVTDLSEYTLRPCLEQDHASLVEMVRERFADVGVGLDLEDIHRDLRDIDECWRATGGEFMVLVHHGVVVGSLAMRPIKGERHFAAEADWFFFRKQYEGKGLSLLLFKWCAAWCQAHHVQWMELWTSESRWWAHKIYKKLGFTHNGIFKVFATTPPSKRLFFELELTPAVYARADRLFSRA